MLSGDPIENLSAPRHWVVAHSWLLKNFFLFKLYHRITILWQSLCRSLSLSFSFSNIAMFACITSFHIITSMGIEYLQLYSFRSVWFGFLYEYKLQLLWTEWLDVQESESREWILSGARVDFDYFDIKSTTWHKLKWISNIFLSSTSVYFCTHTSNL